MRKNLQLHRYLFLLFLLSLFGCAKNKTIVFADNNATVEQVRFACGPACDANGFIFCIIAGGSFENLMPGGNDEEKFNYTITEKFF